MHTPTNSIILPTLRFSSRSSLASRVLISRRSAAQDVINEHLLAGNACLLEQGVEDVACAAHKGQACLGFIRAGGFAHKGEFCRLGTMPKDIPYPCMV